MSLLAGWEFNEKAMGLFLQFLDPEGMDDRYAPRTRRVREQLAHIHDVRLMWLSTSAPDIAAPIEKFGKGAFPSLEDLQAALEISGAGIRKLLERADASGKVRGWKGDPNGFLGYIVSHEAYHRALASAALRVGGHKLSRDGIYAPWN